MKFIFHVELLPDKQQAIILNTTMKEVVATCNIISKAAFKKKLYSQAGLHKTLYRSIKQTSPLPSQIIIRCISRVTESYRINKRKEINFNSLREITFDERVIRFLDDCIAVSTVNANKRIKIPFKGESKYFPYAAGDADMIFYGNKIFLFQSAEIPPKEFFH